MPSAPKNLFDASIARVRSLHALHAGFSAQLTTAVDLSDILRAEFVLIVSALDFYVHERTRTDMLDVWNGVRPATDAFDKWGVSLANTRSAIASANSAWLDAEIRTRHGFLAFQQPDKIADAIRLVSATPLWERLSHRLGQPAVDLKSTLKLIVERRNKIAHEADLDPSFPGAMWPIARIDCEDALSFVEAIVGAIDDELG